MEKITLPDGWHEVNLLTFKELCAIQDNKDVGGLSEVVELISCLSNKDPEEIRSWPSESLHNILPVISWIDKKPSDEYKTNVCINGVNYCLVKFKSLTLGEWIDLDNYIQDSIGNIHKIFAILYRPKNEIYDYSKVEERENLFLEKMSISDVYGTLIFFLTIGNQYLKFIQDYMIEKTQMKM